MRCPRCGSQIDASEKICPNCGRTLTISNTPTANKAASGKMQTADGMAEGTVKSNHFHGVRMVKKHHYQSISPQYDGYQSRKWFKICLLAFLFILVLTVGIYMFLSSTEPGQYLLAKFGCNASATAYYSLGNELMNSGQILKATDAFEIALSREPDNLEILAALGRAYLGSGKYEEAESVYSYAIKNWPVYPESYTQLINMMLEKGRTYEAYQLIELAINNTNDPLFSAMETELLPARPSVSVMGATFKEPFSIELNCTENCQIYYSVLGEDPLTEGALYTAPIFLEEGTWKLRAVAVADNLASKEQTQTYIINKPSPDMPKPSLATNTYSSVRTVTLRAGSDAVAIYYTMDGTIPTTESKLYEGPITLRIGKTVLRAIAVNAEGKISNVMEVEYVCEGRVKTSMQEKDVIDNLKLFDTTQSAFISRYGEPDTTVNDGMDEQGTYTRLYYDFGSAVFLNTGGSHEARLVELYINTKGFSCPRSTGIGSSLDTVLSAFRDEGGEENVSGRRILYTLSSGNMGVFQREEADACTASYYCKCEKNGAYIELTYHFVNDTVTAIDWIWYIPG